MKAGTYLEEKRICDLFFSMGPHRMFEKNDLFLRISAIFGVICMKIHIYIKFKAVNLDLFSTDNL